MGDAAAPDPTRGELAGRDDAMLSSGESGDRPTASVHFFHAPAIRRARWKFCTPGVHFFHRAPGGVAAWKKCTLGHRDRIPPRHSAPSSMRS